MKLVIAIVNRYDSSETCHALTEAGHFYTRISTVGGFISKGNTTLLIGAADDKVQNVIDVIKANGQSRMEPVPTPMGPEGQTTIFSTYTAEVPVGGATIFVTDVEHFEKI